MPNAIVTSSMIANETMRIVHNASAFLGNINVQYDDQFAKSGAKAGSTVNARRPVQYTIRSGATANVQDVNETLVPITLQPEFGIDWAFSDYDLTVGIDKFSERYLEPAGKRLAAELDFRIGTIFKNGVANFTGTPGSTPATVANIMAGVTNLNNFATPQDMRTFAIDPTTNGSIIGGMSGLFNDQATLSRQFKEGRLATNLGVDFQMSQNLPTHTVGPLGGTPLVGAANQGTINTGATDNPYATTTSLATTGWSLAAANRLNQGDVINLAGVFAVNPETKANTGVLMDFVVTANAASDAGGLATVIISPAIIAGGAYQNVSTRPAASAAITVRTGVAGTTYSQNLMFHKDAFTLVTADLELPKGTDMASRATADGVSLRFVRDFDITNNRRICRFDIIAGYGVLRPEWATRITR